jgi:hypothetical protein
MEEDLFGTAYSILALLYYFLFSMLATRTTHRNDISSLLLRLGAEYKLYFFSIYNRVILFNPNWFFVSRSL